MAGQAQTANAAAKKVTQPAFTMQSLCRIALWGTTAATALLVAILASRSDAGSQRIATTPGATHGAPRQFDAESAARQLTQAVRGLTEDRDRLITRLAALEHSLGDITGAIAGQSEKATPPAAQGTTQTGNLKTANAPAANAPEADALGADAPAANSAAVPAALAGRRSAGSRDGVQHGRRCTGGAAVRRIAVSASRHFRRAIAEASDVSPDGRG